MHEDNSSVKWKELRVEGLSAGYGNEPVFRDVQLTLPRGYAYLIRGRNGIGKSTLLRAVAGVIPLLAGRICPQPALDDWRHGLPGSAVFQESLGCFSDLSSLHVMLRVIALRKRAPMELLRHEINLTTDRLGIGGELLRRRQGDLSGGELRLIQIATALLGHPSVMLLDEVFGGLDETSAMGIGSLLVERAKDGNVIIAADQRVGVAEKVGFHVFDFEALCGSSQRIAT